MHYGSRSAPRADALRLTDWDVATVPARGAEMASDARKDTPKCPNCAGLIIEGRGCVVAFAPSHRPPDPIDHQPRPDKVVEYKYRCVNCGETFSVVEEF